MTLPLTLFAITNKFPFFSDSLISFELTCGLLHLLNMAAESICNLRFILFLKFSPSPSPFPFLLLATAGIRDCVPQVVFTTAMFTS